MSYVPISVINMAFVCSDWDIFFFNAHEQTILTQRVLNRLFDIHASELFDLNCFYLHILQNIARIQGAKTEKEISVLEEFVTTFAIIDQGDDTWIKAGRLSFSMKRKGVSMHLVDCYIAVTALENRCKILMLDKHFQDIKRFITLELL